jgi:hypothetical protein
MRKYFPMITIQSGRMRKIFAIAVVAILLTIGVTGGLILLRPNANGWNESNLVEPSIGIIDHPSTTIPGPLTGSYRASSWTLSWLLSQVYVSYGGVAWVSLNNTSNGPIFVYQISLQWSGTNISSGRPTAALIEPGEKVEIGMLSFPAPPSTGYHEYTIQLGLAAGYPNGSWYDYGPASIGGRHEVLVLDHYVSANCTFYHNSPQYYDRINRLIDFSVTAPIAQDVKDRFPGEYSVMQAVEAYEWVRRNIVYLDDPLDYWQSANETWSLRTGDCEDQAILLASVIAELGGNARVNVIEGHAFPTVFVGDNVSVIPSLRDSIASYYWVNATDIHLTYLTDEYGVWLVIDSVGTPYAGGLPSLSAPSSNSFTDDWTFESAIWCHEIDATERVSGGWLPFF